MRPGEWSAFRRSITSPIPCPAADAHGDQAEPPADPLSSWIAFTTRIVPVAPTGWLRATAPPFGLVRLAGKPELPGHGAGQGCEGLVAFDDVETLHAKPGPLKRLPAPSGPAPSGEAPTPRIHRADSTGLKLCGSGEWLLEKHGTTARRSWRKLHIAVDADTGQIEAATLTTNDVDDASQSASCSIKWTVR